MILAFIEDMNNLLGEEFEFDDTMSIEYSNVNAIKGWLNEEEYLHFESCAEEHTDTSIEVYMMVKDPDSGIYKYTWSYYEDFAAAIAEDEDDDIIFEDEDENQIPNSTPKKLFRSLNSITKLRWIDSMDNLADEFHRQWHTGMLVLAYVNNIKSLKKGRFDFDDVTGYTDSDIEELKSLISEDEFQYFLRCEKDHTNTAMNIYLMVDDPEVNQYRLAYSYTKNYIAEQ